MVNKSRSLDQLREHYEIERELASRLRASSRSDRGKLYGLVYDELFQRVPLHPQVTRKADPVAAAALVETQVRMLARFLKQESTFLEVGAGDCALSVAVAARVRDVFAVDVSEEIVRRLDLPENVEVRLSNGTSIPVPPGSINVAFSNQLMEHLHPDDAVDQLSNIYKALAPGGYYVCVTPNRLTGPHDISKYFDAVATGLHLKEYTISELCALSRRVGFRTVSVLVGGHGRYVGLPTIVATILEKAIGALPVWARRTLATRLYASAVLGVRIAARK
jgi:SAM-dependent methyltransferase